MLVPLKIVLVRIHWWSSSTIGNTLLLFQMNESWVLPGKRALPLIIFKLQLQINWVLIEWYPFLFIYTYSIFYFGAIWVQSIAPITPGNHTLNKKIPKIYLILQLSVEISHNRWINWALNAEIFMGTNIHLIRPTTKKS